MAKLIDLTGMVYGDLTVLRRADGVRPTSWVCRCSCGQETTVNADNLRRGLSTRCKSCRITAASQTRRASQTAQKSHIDITGQVFGSLTAIVYNREKHRWLCKCSLCGGQTMLNVTELRSGQRTDCGCIAAKAAADRLAAGMSGHRQGTNINTIRNIMDGKSRQTNTTGVTGVSIRRYKASVAYRARITVCGRDIHLGEFATLDDAHQARLDAEHKYFAPLIAQDEFDQSATKGGPQK